jgi:hypothetical protein
MIHTDIQAALNDPNWGHATPALISGMSTANTKLGVSKNDGKIYVDGQVVGTDMWVSARWNSSCSTPFKHVEGSVYVHSYTCFFNDTTSQVPTLVHFDSTGKADFAVWSLCDNVLTFKPVTPPTSTKSVTCDSLTAEPGTVNTANGTLDYSFMAKATPTNTSIVSYVFDYGDGTQSTITNNQTSAGGTHTYQQSNITQNLTAKVTVNASGATPQSCTAPVSISPKGVTASGGANTSLSCTSLQANQVPGTTDTFTFTANAQPSSNTTITGYTFNFANGNTQTVNTSASSATSQSVQFASGSTHNVTASVTGPLGTFTDNCKTSVTVPAVLAAATTTTPTLPKTGAGSVLGLFGLTSVAGGLFHHFVLRRKFLA